MYKNKKIFLFVLIILFGGTILESQIGYSKSKSKAQAEALRKERLEKKKANSIKRVLEKGELIEENENLSLKEYRSIFKNTWSGKKSFGFIFYRYDFLIENKTDQDLLVKTEILNRITKAEAKQKANRAAEEIIQHYENAGASNGGLIGIWGPEVAKANINKKRRTILYQIDQEFAEDTLIKRVIASGERVLISYLIQAKKDKKPELILAYSKEEDTEKEFISKNLADLEFAKNLLVDESLYQRAYLDGEIQTDSAGFYLGESKLEALNYSSDQESNSQEGFYKIPKKDLNNNQIKKINYKKFREILIKKNLKRLPNEQALILSKVLELKSKDHLIVREKMPLLVKTVKSGHQLLNFEIKELKENLFKLRYKSILPPGKYVLRERDQDQLYLFELFKPEEKELDQ